MTKTLKFLSEVNLLVSADTLRLSRLKQDAPSFGLAHYDGYRSWEEGTLGPADDLTVFHDEAYFA